MAPGSKHRMHDARAKRIHEFSAIGKCVFAICCIYVKIQKSAFLAAMVRFQRPRRVVLGTQWDICKCGFNKNRGIRLVDVDKSVEITVLLVW